MFFRLYRNFASDVRPGVIALKLKVFVLKVENGFHIGIYLHLWQRSRCACKLQLYLFYVVSVDVGITKGMNEIACFKIADLRHHLKQQGIGSNVERYAKKGVGTTLIHLQTKAAIGYIELKEHVARR